MRRFRLALFFAITAALFARVGSAGEGDTLITDPDLLARLGFPSDARNVYLAKGAVLDQKSSSPTEPEEFGTADSGWTTVLGNQHHPREHATVYGGVGAGSIAYFSGGDGVFEAQLQMPSGALFQQVTWFGRDQSVDSFTGTVVRVCQTGFPAVGPPVVTFLGTAGSANAESSTFVVSVPAGETVHNLSCAYFAKTFFSGAGTDLTLHKVRAGWRRQVSAAPLNATFPNDTPTTHPYFRFIEALAASGITAGCAPGFFCPNNPITRGEMAVFLSVALGLHSPN
jgi:hypothetical protein